MSGAGSATTGRDGSVRDGPATADACGAGGRPLAVGAGAEARAVAGAATSGAVVAGAGTVVVTGVAADAGNSAGVMMAPDVTVDAGARGGATCVLCGGASCGDVLRCNHQTKAAAASTSTAKQATMISHFCALEALAR